jgi:peroxiredoxin Q/BCP
MRASGGALRSFDVAYFSASCDSPETNQRFAASLGLDFPILSDPSGETAARFGVVGPSRPLPQRWTFYIGSDGKILEIDRAVRTASHGEDIATRLKALGIPERP